MGSKSAPTRLQFYHGLSHVVTHVPIAPAVSPGPNGVDLPPQITGGGQFLTYAAMVPGAGPWEGHTRPTGYVCMPYSARTAAPRVENRAADIPSSARSEPRAVSVRLETFLNFRLFSPLGGGACRWVSGWVGRPSSLGCSWQAHAHVPRSGARNSSHMMRGGL